MRGNGPEVLPRPDRRRQILGVALTLGLLGAATVVWQSSHAAFTGTTSNDGNLLGAGTVVITDNDAGTAMFAAPNLAPGQTAAVCMGVQYTGSLTPAAIKVYTGGAQESNNGGTYVAWANDTTSEMDDNTNLEIEVNNSDLATNPGTSCAPAGVGTFTDVAAAAPGTGLRALISTNTNFGNGLPSQWGTVTANQWRVWRFTYTLSASASNSAQGDGVRFNIVWEVQR